MAYLDLRDGGARAMVPGVTASEAASLQVQDGHLLPVEWTIVRLAREDGLSSLREESRLGRLLRLVFGSRRAMPLASARLEALRRIAVLSWHHGYNIAPSELGRFYEAGYTTHQYETLLRHIGALRLSIKRRNRA
ncbi:hypothetical protein [Sphingobium sp. B12D2B]|uniref:hypothetical protein n=1 Tax=Sphingobium sp. B12D2B TaxID=2940577 RepID=UPI0022254DF9|nr:hypothetical protein [Sphingobium sp. B12D2B]MCW2351511.1 hypothetical protein [Sphingobium sp. B12D2B]